VPVGKNAANAGGQNTSRVDNSQVQTSSGISAPCGEWCEATTPEGYVYYWNTITKGELLQLFNEMCLCELSLCCCWFSSDFLLSFLCFETVNCM